MKKILSLIIAISVMALGLTACASNEGGAVSDNGKKQIVATIFPEYDWVKNILGDNPGDFELTLLLDKGVDLHSFQPTSQDIMKVSSCDMLIYAGGESDEWLEDALKEAVNKDMIVVNLLDALGDDAKEEELVEGMQAEEEEEEADEEEAEVEFDEHVWLSLRNAKSLVETISEAIQKLDSDNADTYKTNTEAYIEKLDKLDNEYKEAVDAAANKTVLFGDRFPFRYLVDDYGLDYYAAFVGCSAETEASFETITFLSKKLDELSLPVVLTIEGNDGKIAETIIQNSKAKNQKILILDSMQSSTKDDADNGIDYISIMESNLDVLKEALK